MGRGNVLFHGLNHATCEAPSTAHVLIRGDSHLVGAKFFVGESTAVVYDVHAEMFGDIVVGTKNLFLH